ncbi:hypothetical protein HS121_14310 [bacterium]|nr:hypothetical protein [bacterium]
MNTKNFFSSMAGQSHRPFYHTRLLLFIFFLTSTSFAETFTQDYHSDGKDYFMDVNLQLSGEHKFAVNGVPIGTFQYRGYKRTSGNGDYNEIYSEDTITGWDPSFTTYVADGYTVKLVIYDSKWSVKSVYYWPIHVLEVISTPSKPTSPSSSGLTGENFSFLTGGSTSSVGHSVEYRFDWGDGSTSPWGSSQQNHAYSNPGTYSIKAQARCQTHTSKTSGWSGSLSVFIERPKAGDILEADPDSFTGGSKQVKVVVKNLGRDDANLIVEHEAPSGWSITPIDRQTVVPYNSTNSDYFTFTVTPPASDSNAQIEWRLYWDDTWPAKNTLLDTYSQSVTNTVEEVISTPTKPSGPSSGLTGENLSFLTGGSTSSNGHSVEYRFDWGDGSTSPLGKLPTKSCLQQPWDLFY